MILAEELRASLQNLLASGSFEISESGGRVTPLPPVSWEVRGAPAKSLLQIWSENCNLTRRPRHSGTQSNGKPGPAPASCRLLDAHPPSSSARRFGALRIFFRNAVAVFSPIVYLVAPTLHFHPTTAAIISWLSPELEIVGVGRTENSKRGPRVTTRR
jgi:hypothetical protein